MMKKKKMKMKKKKSFPDVSGDGKITKKGAIKKKKTQVHIKR